MHEGQGGVARCVLGTLGPIGIMSALAFLLMLQEGTATNRAFGQAFVALYRRSFLIGPGFLAGLAKGVIIGYMLYRSELVP